MYNVHKIPNDLEEYFSKGQQTDYRKLSTVSARMNYCTYMYSIYIYSCKLVLRRSLCVSIQMQNLCKWPCLSQESLHPRTYEYFCVKLFKTQEIFWTVFYERYIYSLLTMYFLFSSLV